jgi:hypothetical protein
MTDDPVYREERVERLSQLIHDAGLAIEGGDYVTAEKKLLAAEVILAVMPSMTRGANGVLWSERIQVIRRAIAIKRGSRSQTCKVEYVRPTS